MSTQEGLVRNGKPIEVYRKAVMMCVLHPHRWMKPGGLIEALSPEDREALKDLKSDEVTKERYL